MEGLASEGLALEAAAREAIRSFDSSSESSMTPFGGALDSGSPRVGAAISSVLTMASPSSFFTIMASSCEGVVANDGVGAKATGDAEAEDDDVEGDGGGETPADCPGESPSNRRGILWQRSVVLVLMTIDVEMLS